MSPHLRLLVCLCLLLWPLVAQSATYTVPSGSGNNSSCSNIGTIQYAINNCWRNPGDVLDIRAGTYDEQLHGTLGTNWPSGTASQPMIMQGHPGETVILRPTGSYTTFTLMYFPSSSYLTFRNLVMDGSGLTISEGAQFFRPDGTSHHLVLEDSVLQNGETGCSGPSPPCGYFMAILFGVDNITLRRLDISGVDGYGAYISGGNNLVEECYVHNVKGYGFHFYKSGGSSVVNNVARNNRLINNGFGNRNPAGSNGMIFASGGNNLAYNNLIVGSNGGGIQIYGFNNDGNQLYNNTIVGNGGGPCIVIENPGTAPASNTVVEGNICYGNGQDIQNNGTGSIISNNNPNSNNPRFVDPPNGNYRLQTAPTPSDALNHADNLSSIFTGDITSPTTGLVRPATGPWDQGAYEMEAGGPILNPSKGTFFIDDTGTNTTDCDAAKGAVGSPSASPFGDYATARVCMLAGSTLYFRAGTYPPLDTNVTPFAGGTSTEPTTLAAYPGETATLQATTLNPVAVFLHNATTDHFLILQGLIIDGLNIAGGNGFAAVGINDIRLDGVEVKNTYFEGVFLSQTSNIALRNGTKVHNSAFAGVGVVGLDRTTNTLLSGVEVYASGGPGISSYGGNSNLTIEKSTIRNTPAGKGILLGNASNPDSGVQIANSLIYTNTHGIHLQNGTTGAKLYYNTLWNNSTACMLFDSGVTVSEAINNICWQVATLTNNAGSGMVLTTNQTTDPSFVSTTPGDPNFLRLGATSTARDSGTPIASLTTDLTGKNRPDGTGVDKGAYEEVPPPPVPVQVGLVPPFRTTHFLTLLP